MARPSCWSCSMAWRAAARAAWWRRALAWARNAELSARFIAGTGFAECFEGGDDLVQAGLDAAQVLAVMHRFPARTRPVTGRITLWTTGGTRIASWVAARNRPRD